MTNETPLKAVWSEIAEEVAGIGFWRMDSATGVVDWSPNMFRLFEFPFGPAPNAEQTMSRIHPDDRADAYVDLSSNLQAGGHITISRILLPSGGVRVVESRTLAQRDALGEVVSIVGSVQDITDRMQREHKPAHGKEPPEHRAFQTPSLATELSHEVRTPLMAVIGYAHLLMAREDVPEGARRDLENLSQSGKALLSVANTVLGRAKAGAALAATAAAPVSIGALVDKVFDVFSQQAALKSIALRHLAAGHFPPFLETHADALTQILINLVGNALKFTDCGSVTVSTDYDPHFGVLSIVVADTGRGFDSATREGLFQRFFQGAGASSLPSGAGLGLSICKGLVDALEGSIEVDSAPGSGSQFTVRLHAQESAPPSSPDPGHTAASVLIIDDHPANREIASRILTDAGAFVVVAATASAGLEAASSQPFNLILLDLHLPDMTGAAVASTIRSSAGPNVSTPVCAFTAADIEETSLPAGFTGLLKKPYDPSALVELAFRYR